MNVAGMVAYLPSVISGRFLQFAGLPDPVKQVIMTEKKGNSFCFALTFPTGGRKIAMIFSSKERIVFAGDSVTDMGSAQPFGEGLFDNVGRGYVRGFGSLPICKGNRKC